MLGLTIFGGGVATTAGGVKLLRIYTLYAQGRHEMNMLVHPHSVAGNSGAVRRIPPGGIEAAWGFFMLFATSIAAVTQWRPDCRFGNALSRHVRILRIRGGNFIVPAP